MIKDRAILHCDLNNFFASVEVILNPALRGNAVAVCGDPKKRHGIVLAKCEIAKRHGVKTGDTVNEAEKKCPSIIIVCPQHNEYSKYSRKVREIYYRFTDEVESFGIDECGLDVTNSKLLFGTGEQIAEKIKSTVKEELGLTISIGVSWNKTYAKLGSDFKKPDAITIISRQNYRNIIYPSPISSMLYVGRKTRQMFERMNIKTIGDLANFDPALLRARMGIMAAKLIQAARGEDDDEVMNFLHKDDVKSVGNGATLARDLTTVRQVEKVIYVLAEEVGTRMRRKGVQGKTISLGIRGNDLKWTGAQASIQSPTHNPMKITHEAMKIFNTLWNVGNIGVGTGEFLLSKKESLEPIRSLRVAVSNLTDAQMSQLDFLDRSEIYSDDLTKTFDNLRKKYGSSSISFAMGIGAELEIEFEVLDGVSILPT